ncbi:glycosyltransferase family 4 protein [Flavobacterium frigoris]|uniref:Glycosyltransferase n=1 Tax=Flavobacterium frigoris (strain PS1) TaxID=1086011 RepID=H7FM67_FLAFP|nr:glycosyltransferase family 4 protein [Flavobacterium frigoris]EIA10405.1 glycosyltransferase [Flavobacterium frigoris PS1]
MHICLLTNEYPKEGFPHGGLGSFVKTLAEALVKSGVKVSVIGLNYTPNEEIQMLEGVKVYRLKRSKLRGLAWFFNSTMINATIASLNKKYPINIVESPELGLAFINKIKNINYVIRLHGGHHFFAEAEKRGINRWKGFQEKRSFQKSDAFIAISRYVKSHTETYLSYLNKPVVYINNPINTKLFTPVLGNEKEGQIVFAGTVCEKKGVRQLIQAFPLIKKQFPKATLEIYGRDWLFPDGSSYMQMLKDKELPLLGVIAKDLHFNGAIPFTEIPSIYAQAEVCVFPSHMETLGLVAPEAMAMQKAVVFTNKGPGPEIIIDGKTGLLCNPHSPRDIAAKIIWMLEHKQEAQQMGVEAGKAILERFDLEVLVQENICFYEQIIKS